MHYSLNKMIIPSNRYTQKQLNFWIKKAKEAKESYDYARAAHNDDKEKYKWGYLFIMDIISKTADQNVWRLQASRNFRPRNCACLEEVDINEPCLACKCWNYETKSKVKGGMEDQSLLTNEFGFLYLTDKYCFFSEKSGGGFLDCGLTEAFRTTMIPCAHTLWIDPYGMKPDRRGWGNVIFNGAMINHGTIENPSWSSHT